MKNKKTQRIHRHKRVKNKLLVTKDAPRLVVFRSNKHIYAQIIDDINAKTLIGESDIKLKEKNKIESAKTVGSQLAKKATKKDIKKVTFDRAGYKYHGRIKALADAVREGGLTF